MSVTPDLIEPVIRLAAALKVFCSRLVLKQKPLFTPKLSDFLFETGNMDFCCVSSVILFLFFVVMLRTVCVVKRRKGHGPLDRRKHVKVMVVAGSGTLML